MVGARGGALRKGELDHALMGGAHCNDAMISMAPACSNVLQCSVMQRAIPHLAGRTSPVRVPVVRN